MKTYKVTTEILDKLNLLSTTRLVCICIDYNIEITTDRESMINAIDAEIYLGNICFEDLK